MAAAMRPAFAAAAPSGIASRAERLRCALLWLTGLSGAFVFIEPSPYEVVSIATLLVFAIGGLALSAPLVPLGLLLVTYNIGIVIALEPDRTDAVIWTLISVYLSVSAIFFAAMVATSTQARLSALMRGYMTGAVVASLVAIAGYFHLFGDRSAVLLLYERARGTFHDPNVLGAFLVLPLLIAYQRILSGSARAAIKAGPLLLVLLTALFLSFSRGAWGQFMFAALVLMALTFITSRSAAERMRIVLIAGLGALAAAAFVAALLSIDQVAELFKERASFEQSYDLGHTGRFGRHVLGFMMALERPLGIGALHFHRLFLEDPHNAYLNAFLSGGWLAGFSYLTLTVVTLAMGFRFAFVSTPWRPHFQTLYAAYAGLVAESAIIDSDHWRHYFLVVGLIWGLMAVSRPYLRRGSRRDVAPPARVAAVPALARTHPSS